MSSRSSERPGHRQAAAEPLGVALDPVALQAAAFDDLADGESRGVDAHGRGCATVFVVRHRGRLVAYEDRCPHYGDTPLAWRRDGYLNGDRTRIVCAAHGAQFDIETGACLLGPCLGQSLTPVSLVHDRSDDDRRCAAMALTLAMQMTIPT